LAGEWDGVVERGNNFLPGLPGLIGLAWIANERWWCTCEKGMLAGRDRKLKKKNTHQRWHTQSSVLPSSSSPVLGEAR
jgi:hypothetical protein